jgi:hypothetical protein
MPYTLTKLAPGSYDIHLNGRIIGSIVRGGSADAPVWIAELLTDLPPGQRPHPFLELEHEFATLEDVRLWLGIPESRSGS